MTACLPAMQQQETTPRQSSVQLHRSMLQLLLLSAVAKVQQLALMSQSVPVALHTQHARQLGLLVAADPAVAQQLLAGCMTALHLQCAGLTCTFLGMQAANTYVRYHWYLQA